MKPNLSLLAVWSALIVISSQAAPAPQSDTKAALKSLVLDLGNRVTMKFVRIPAGAFMMGSPTDEKGRSQSEFFHEVTIAQPFWVGAFEVTQEQYQAVMGNNPSQIKGAGRPVEGVNW